jgi:hypothetical protein
MMTKTADQHRFYRHFHQPVQRTHSYLSKVISSLVTVLALAQTSSSSRASVIYSNSAGGLAAKAEFDLSGTTLTLALTNVGTNNVTTTAQTLTALFFDLAGNPTIPPVSAVCACCGGAGPDAARSVECGWLEPAIGLEPITC